MLKKNKWIKERKSELIKIKNGMVKKDDLVEIKWKEKIGLKLKIVDEDGEEGGKERIDEVEEEKFGMENWKLRIIEKILWSGRSIGKGDEENGGSKKDIKIGIGNGREKGMEKWLRKGWDEERIELRGKKKEEMVGGKERKSIMRINEER